MKYRPFGALDWKVSALGFGCMRLPTIDNDYGRIDEPEATRMVRHAIDHGVNYIDTAYGYHEGNSERFVGRVLQDGYREKVHLATKLPCWEVKTAADFDRLLNEQMEKLLADQIDFYLLHALGRDSWDKVNGLGVLDWAEGAITDGRIRYLGFSFHDDYPAFHEIIDAYDRWTFCQIQYNYMDVENQAGTQGLEYAASRGLSRGHHGATARRQVGQRASSRSNSSGTPRRGNARLPTGPCSGCGTSRRSRSSSAA